MRFPRSRLLTRLFKSGWHSFWCSPAAPNFSVADVSFDESAAKRFRDTKQHASVIDPATHPSILFMLWTKVGAGLKSRTENIPQARIWLTRRPTRSLFARQDLSGIRRSHGSGLIRSHEHRNLCSRWREEASPLCAITENRFLDRRSL